MFFLLHTPTYLFLLFKDKKIFSVIKEIKLHMKSKYDLLAEPHLDIAEVHFFD
jgi:hypothetical protein